MKESKWETVSVELDPLHAEKLAALFEEILPGGVVLERNYGDLFPHELDDFQGPVRLIGYFPAENRQEVSSGITRVLKSFGQGSLLEQIEYSPLENQDWATAWQDRYQPIKVGTSLAVVPTWLDNPFPNRIPIQMDPGMAFGSGTHSTTQLSLALLEAVLTVSLPGEMIDVGCGSGILSIGGAKLGVKKVLGVDIDPDAIRISAENAKVNGVSENVSFREGSVKEILSQEWGMKDVPLVTANIIAPILKDLFVEGLGELVEPAGIIVLSGILEDQLPEIMTCLDDVGFRCLDRQQQGDWIGLIAEKAATQ